MKTTFDVDPNAFLVGFFVVWVSALASWGVLTHFEQTYAARLDEQARRDLMRLVITNADAAQAAAGVVAVGVALAVLGHGSVAATTIAVAGGAAAALAATFGLMAINEVRYAKLSLGPFTPLTSVLLIANIACFFGFRQ